MQVVVPGVVTVAPAAPSAPSLSRPVSACLLYDDNLDVEPGKIIAVRVNIVEGVCASKDELAAEQAIKTITPGKTSREDVVIGSKVKVSFLAPLYDADVGGVIESVQTFDGTNTGGQWAWRLRLNRAGDLALPLRLTLYDASGDHVVTEKEIGSVQMHVPFTFGYVVSNTWTGIIVFFTSLQGLIASIAGAAAGTAGFRAWTVKKARKDEVLTSIPVAVSTSSGYL